MKAIAHNNKLQNNEETPFPVPEREFVCFGEPNQLSSLVFPTYRLAVCYPIYWTKNVILAGVDRLPALSTAMRVIVLSPV